MKIDPVEIEAIIGGGEEKRCQLHDWMMLPSRRILAARYVDHPKLGSGNNLMTGTILFIDRERGEASSKRTNYKLFKEYK